VKTDVWVYWKREDNREKREIVTAGFKTHSLLSADQMKVNVKELGGRDARVNGQALR